MKGKGEITVVGLEWRGILMINVLKVNAGKGQEGRQWWWNSARLWCMTIWISK